MEKPNQRKSKGVDLPAVRLVVLHGLPRTATDMLQQGGRAGRDQQEAEIRCLQLNSDTKNPQVAGDVKTACLSGCLRGNLLGLFNQVKVATSSCCSICQPDPEERTMLQETPDKSQVQRIAGKITSLKSDLEALAQSSAPGSLFSSASAVLSAKEIDMICRGWDSLKSEHEVCVLLRRRVLPTGIMNALEAYRRRLTEPTPSPEKAKKQTGKDKTPKDKPAKVKPVIPPEMVSTFTVVMKAKGKNQKRK